MVFLELLASRGVAGRWPGLREPAIWREMGRRGESDHRGGFSLSPADREQESLPALFPRPALPPAFRPGAGSATCVTRSPISAGGSLLLGMEAAKERGHRSLLPSTAFPWPPAGREAAWGPACARAHPALTRAAQPSLWFHPLCSALTVLPDPSL